MPNMFDLGSYELMLAVLVALVVIGPKDLPALLRFVGRWVSKARAVVAQFRLGIDDMVRQSELKDMEQKWQAENERIMREFPDNPAAPDMTGDDQASTAENASDAAQTTQSKASGDDADKGAD